MNEKKYSINDLAKIIGVPVSTLRFYQKNKLIRPSQKDEKNGYYYYTAKDIQRVEKTVLLRSMGVPVKTIEKILDGKQTPQSAFEILKEYSGELKNQIRKSNYFLERVEKILDNYNKIREYDVPFGTFEIRFYEDREVLAKKCMPFKPGNSEEWIIQFSEHSERKKLPDEIPGILMSMGVVVSRRKYQALETIVTDHIFLDCGKREELNGWTNDILKRGNYLAYHYDGKKISHEEAFARIESYIEEHHFQTDDTFFHIMVESMMPIICTNIAFEIQIKLL